MSAKDVWDFAITPLVDGAKAIPARLMLAQSHKRSLDARKDARAAAKKADEALDVARATRDAVRQIAEGLAAEEQAEVLRTLGDNSDLNDAAQA